MKRLLFKSYVLLVRLDLATLFGSFRTLHNLVKYCSVARMTLPPAITSERICHAVDLACVFYFKKVMCLQRSAATTLLLRNCGFPAELVIGARPLPFKSHAWVELNGIVVNDKPYVSETYRQLERC